MKKVQTPMACFNGFIPVAVIPNVRLRQVFIRKHRDRQNVMKKAFEVLYGMKREGMKATLQ